MGVGLLIAKVAETDDPELDEIRHLRDTVPYFLSFDRSITCTIFSAI